MDLDPNIRLFIPLCISLIIVHHLQTNKTVNIRIAVFCDHSKAFDVINHRILLHKLNNCGIRGIINRWFENYLFERTQFVEFGGQRSSTQNIQCGVPTRLNFSTFTLFNLCL